MLSRVAACRLLSVLALASLLAWTSHVLAGLATVQGRTAPAAHELHPPIHDAGLSRALCGDHQHSPLTVDHLHETPHLGTWLRLPVLAEEQQPAASLPQRLPDSPRTRIERPPRS